MESQSVKNPKWDPDLKIATVYTPNIKSQPKLHLFKFYLNLGMACHLPGSFLSSVVSIIDAKSFASAIRQNILCGGN